MQLQLYGDKIWLMKKPVDFRQSIDGLCNLIINNFGISPTQGLFIFYNRGKDKIKILSWHRNGFLLLYKRLESGKFKFNFSEKDGRSELMLQELSWLLAGLDWQQMIEWKELNYEKFS